MGRCPPILLALLLPALASPALAARPDQVLVLYNHDWTEDRPGSRPGQDSEEVARYYVRRHTDPKTGRKPYLLGLSARRGEGSGRADGGGDAAAARSPLNQELLPEASSDNAFGVVYTGEGRLPRGQKHYLLSSRIECRLPLSDVDLDTVKLTVRPAGEEAEPVVVYDASAAEGPGGKAVRVSDVEQRPGRLPALRVLRFDAKRAGHDGELLVTISAGGRGGKKAIRESALFFDPADFAFSRTGGDGRRDDAAYLELIEHPVKAFLQDPKNAVDGRPLKDHILYVVLCHGLPRRVARHYGIAQTAVADSLYEHAGATISLGQRLEMAYYDVEAVRPPRVVPYRHGIPGPFVGWMPLSNYRSPFAGRHYQPYMHPAAYRGFRGSADYAQAWPTPPHFTAEARAAHPRRRLFLCSRIDALDAEASKEMIDSAEYGQAYLTPGIDSPAKEPWDGAAALLKTKDLRGGTAELERLGLPGVGTTRSGRLVAYFGRRAGGGYYPGAVDWYLTSSNIVLHSRTAVRRMLASRVTATGGAAGGGDCPHTTTHAWWDGRVFVHYLLRGYDLGEAWLLSRYYIGWVTSFFGDPLYRPDLRRTRADTTPPRVARADDISVAVGQAAGRQHAVLRVKLAVAAGAPDLVTTEVSYWPKGREGAARRADDDLYRKRPRAVLADLAPQTTYEYRLLLTDPYRNVFDSREVFGLLTFRTGEAPQPRREPLTLTGASKVPVAGRKDRPNASAGQIDLTYVAGKAERATLLACGGLNLHKTAHTVQMTVGAGHLAATYALEAGRTYRLRIRYSERPLSRELWLIAANGEAFCLCADNYTPWQAMKMGRWMTFADSGREGHVRSASLYADAPAPSFEGSRLGATFDAEAFEKADRPR
jgi:hypothetical protein